MGCRGNTIVNAHRAALVRAREAGGKAGIWGRALLTGTKEARSPPCDPVRISVRAGIAATNVQDMVRAAKCAMPTRVATNVNTAPSYALSCASAVPLRLPAGASPHRSGQGCADAPCTSIPCNVYLLTNSRRSCPGWRREMGRHIKLAGPRWKLRICKCRACLTYEDPSKGALGSRRNGHSRGD